ncbi:MAG TPA: DUF5916 domain-containing protein, partial [Thermoanaerobaculia bacterium]|nr:DUF5916 domain-containing protein [Thermoanaerobaculia bacterium]
DRRYQIFSAKLPRGQNCFVCNFEKTSVLENLPSGGHLVAAPYTTMRQFGERESGLGTPIRYGDAGGEIGADLKWTPNADTAIDATVNPDFSQIESDVAAISTNERFALFYPERRPFFLEGVELFNTPIPAVYTRTITSPRWGLRSTGKAGNSVYTLLVAQDRGGGSVVIPSTYGSDFAPQDFSSIAAIGRIRRDYGQSFVSFLGTTREVSGGGHNRVFGPDVQVKNEHHTLTGQFLVSDTKTPNRPGDATGWDGRSMRGTAAWVYYTYSGKKWDYLVDGRSFSDDFRADNGFVPQVGHRVNYSELGRTFYPEKSFFSRVRTFAQAEYDSTQEGKQLYKLLSIGAGADGRYRSFSQLRYAWETIRDRENVFTRRQLRYNFSVAVSKVVSNVYLNGSVGEDIDFFGARLGEGANVNFGGTLRPTSHLAIDLTNSLRWLSVPNAAGDDDRLFTSQVERLRATYTFNNRMFIRTIVQNQRTNRDRSLYGAPVAQHSGNLASQLLFGYKLNWQTLLYVGAGDLREVDAEGDMHPSSREVFLKVSYAFQR